MTCRGSVDPKKVTDWNSFKKIHMEKALVPNQCGAQSKNEDGSEDEEDESDTETESEDESEDGSQDSNLSDFIDDEGDNDETTDGEIATRYKSKGNDRATSMLDQESGDDKDDKMKIKLGKSKSLRKSKGKRKGKCKKVEKNPLRAPERRSAQSQSSSEIFSASA